MKIMSRIKMDLPGIGRNGISIEIIFLAMAQEQERNEQCYVGISLPTF
jgi:hypothetical protein